MFVIAVNTFIFRLGCLLITWFCFGPIMKKIVYIILINFEEKWHLEIFPSSNVNIIACEANLKKDYSRIHTLHSFTLNYSTTKKCKGVFICQQ